MREGWNAGVIPPTHLSFLSVHFHFLCARVFMHSLRPSPPESLLGCNSGWNPFGNKTTFQPKDGLPVLNQEFRDPAKSFLRLVKKLIKNVHLLPFSH